MTPPDGNRLGFWIEMEVEAGLRKGADHIRTQSSQLFQMAGL